MESKLLPPYTDRQRADFIFKYDYLNYDFEFNQQTSEITAYKNTQQKENIDE